MGGDGNSGDEQPDSVKANRWGLPEFTSAARHVATKSVMSPLQWILAIVASFCIFAVIFAPDPWVRGGAFLLVLAATIFAGWKYDYFSRKRPELLQSENYRHAQAQLRHEARLLLDERNRGNFKVLEGQPTANTHIPEPGSITAVPYTEIVKEEKSAGEEDV